MKLVKYCLVKSWTMSYTIIADNFCSNGCSNKYMHREYKVQLLDMSRFEMTRFASIHYIQMGLKTQLSKILNCLTGTLCGLILNYGISNEHTGCSKITVYLSQSTLKVISLNTKYKNLLTFCLYLAPPHSLCQYFTYFSIYVIISHGLNSNLFFFLCFNLCNWFAYPFLLCPFFC